MFKRSWLMAMTAVVLMTAPALGQVKLARKIMDGSQYKTKSSIKLNQKLTLGGQDGSTASATTLQQQTSVGKRDGEGKLPLTVTTEIRSADITLPGGLKIKFDGKETKTEVPDDSPLKQIAELVADRLKSASARKHTVLLDKQDQIVEVQGLKPEDGVTEDDVKQGFAEEAKLLPDTEVKKGDTWEREVKINLGQGQLFTVKRKYTYEGETAKSTVTSTRKVHKITAVDQSVVYSVKEGGALPGKVTKSDLKIAESKHTILFDAEQGREVDSASSIRVTGTLALSIMGIELNGDLDLTMETRSEEQ